MVCRLFHTLHLLLVFESIWGKLESDDHREAVRQGADVPPVAEERVFAHESASRDMVYINMFKVYENYSKEPQSQRDGNTVRSFKAVPSEWHLFITERNKNFFQLKCGRKKIEQIV